MAKDVGFCEIKLPCCAGDRRNILYTSIFNSRKRHITFRCRQRAQQVLPSLVSGPSPTKSGYMVNDPCSPTRDGPATLTCHGSHCASPRESHHAELERVTTRDTI